jgi:3-ketosteroid 9alpha-monooxygenase subunit A
MMTSRLPYDTMAAGWYPILYGDEVGAAEVVSLRYFARDLIAWRDADSRVRVFDAICPHLGANLSYGARLVDGCVECPYHHFRYGPDGACVAVGYAKRINDRARVRTFPVIERNQQVYVWYHPDAAEPTWEPPIVPELSTADFTGIDFRHDFTEVRTAWHEVAEQTVDRGHTVELHGVPIEQARVCRAEEHVFMVDVTHPDDESVPFGRGGDLLHIELHGPGIALMRYRGSLELLLTATTLPITPELLTFRLGVACPQTDDRDETAAIGALVLAGFVDFVQQDIEILNHKVFLDRPALVDGDGDFTAFRRWMRQFHEPAAVMSPAAAT